MQDEKKTITTIAATDGKSIAVAGGSYRIVISGKETGGAYAIIEMLVPPQGGPGPHAHAAFQESFYILDGEVEVKTEEATYTAKQGSFVNIPLGGLVHCFKNKTSTMARLWCTVVPAGLDAFFEEIGMPAPFGTFPPSPPMDAETMKKMQAIAEKYGQKLFPPGYLD